MIQHQTCSYSFGYNSFMMATRGGCWQRLHMLERRQQKTREGDRRSKDAIWDCLPPLVLKKGGKHVSNRGVCSTFPDRETHKVAEPSILSWGWPV
jgi:hypothetical protein